MSARCGSLTSIPLPKAEDLRRGEPRRTSDALPAPYGVFEDPPEGTSRAAGLMAPFLENSLLSSLSRARRSGPTAPDPVRHLPARTRPALPPRAPHPFFALQPRAPRPLPQPPSRPTGVGFRCEEPFPFSPERGGRRYRPQDCKPLADSGRECLIAATCVSLALG